MTLNGREFYLGHWPVSRGKKPPPSVQAAYDDLIATWLANGRQVPEERPPLSVNEVLLAYLTWAERHYVPKRKKDDQNRLIRYSAAVVRELFGRTPAAEFGPKKLKAVRQAMIDRGWCRNMVNAQVDRVKRMFKWAVAEELVPGDVYHALRAVESLRRGTPGVRDTDPVKPVPVEAVEAVLPHLQPVIRAMVRVQMLSDIRGLGGAGVGGREGKPAGSLLLEGMIRFDTDPPPTEGATEANRIRLTALRGRLGRLKTALAELAEQVERKVHPPEVKDRVKVDVERHVLTIDGREYELNTTNQARILEQMALANGEPLSGPELARRAGLREGFMVARALEQVRKKHHPKLNRFIPLAVDVSNKFCFRLPPTN